MPYTSSKTWATGDTLLASDLDTEFEAIEKFSERLDPADISTGKWADYTLFQQPHILLGSYGDYKLEGISGSNHFRSFSYTKTGYVMHIGATAQQVTDGEWTWVPGTGVSFELRRPAVVVATWQLYPRIDDTGGLTSGYVMYRPVFTDADEGMHFWPHAGALHIDSENVTNARNTISGQRLIKLSTIGTNHFALQGKILGSDIPSIRHWSYEVSLVVYYI